MPATLLIRKAVDTDLRSLHALFNRSRRAAGCFIAFNTTFDDFVYQIEGEDIFLAGSDEQIMGFVSLWTADHFIHHLYIAPDAQRQGVGTALIQHCRFTYGLPLSLKCDVVNVAGQAFYQHHGFQPGKESGTDINGRWIRLWLT